MRRILPLLLVAPALAGDERPNILFVFTDDHAAHAISAYGSNRNQTPNIDRLAREGMLFENCFCGNSICAPSRATVLTGLHSHANGVLDNRLAFDGSQQTLPKLLQAAGYQTAMIGKWHLKSDPTGFDHWQVLIGQGPYYNPPIKSPAGTTTYEGYTTEVITDLALGWLVEGRDPQRPFLLMYQHKAPHRNWQPGPRELGMFGDEPFAEPATLFDDWSHRNSGCQDQTMTIAEHMNERDLKLEAPGNLTPDQREAWDAWYVAENAVFERRAPQGDDLVRWKYQRYMQDYMACITAVDRELGRVLDHLDESGLTEDTVVVYSSDQGFYLGEHGWYDKRWMYEESLRMPLVVRWPGEVAPGSRNGHLVQNIDFAPTLLEIAGVTETPEPMHGASFVPLLRGADPATWRRSIYYHYYEFPGAHSVPRHHGVRTETHKLIRYEELEEWELFDLVADPDELRSVHGDPGYAEVQAQLERELTRLQVHYGEPDPLATAAGFGQERARQRASRVKPRAVFRVADADAQPPEAPDPAGKPLTVGVAIEPTGPDGVAVAQGGASYGYALSLRGGRPVFTVTNRDQRFEAIGPALEADAGWTHLAGTLDAAGRLVLHVDGEAVAEAEGQVIEQKPGDPLDLGRDGGSPVTAADGESPFPGRWRDLRLDWGAHPAATLAAWSTEALRGG